MRTHPAWLRRAGLLALFVFPLLIAGCSGGPTAPRFVSDTGTVRYNNLEGGFYGIIGDGGGRYDPVNLDAAAQVDGLRVRFVGHSVPDGVSVHMWGTMIEIDHLEILR